VIAWVMGMDEWEREYGLSLVVEIGMGIGSRESKKGYKRWFSLMERGFGATMHQDFSSYLSTMELSPFQFFQ
jgi:hypothetical protein